LHSFSRLRLLLAPLRSSQNLLRLQRPIHRPPNRSPTPPQLTAANTVATSTLPPNGMPAGTITVRNLFAPVA
jgi:hypothetical protein